MQDQDGVKVNQSSDTVIPIDWAIAVHWSSTPDDEGKLYEQRITFVSPSGEIQLEAINPFVMTSQSYNHVHRCIGIAMTPGEFRLTLELREEGYEDWDMIASHPIVISLLESPPVTS